MGYNLWSSEDIAYTLSHRVGSRPSDATADAHVQEPDRLNKDEADRIEMLMVEVARRLETRAPAAS